MTELISGKRSTLIFSPHVDDEVLGCFSFLNENTHVLYCGVESRVDIPKETRLAELTDSAQALGFSYELLDNPVNRYVTSELIQPFETAITTIKPSTVLLPIPSYNQDHRSVYDAALVATRPHDTLFQVKRVLGFEQPHSEIWPYGNNGKPTAHRIINIEDKINAYNRYASQVRGHRSAATVSALAALRGAEIGVAHAESFHVLRWLDTE